MRRALAVAALSLAALALIAGPVLSGAAARAADADGGSSDYPVSVDVIGTDDSGSGGAGDSGAGSGGSGSGDSGLGFGSGSGSSGGGFGGSGSSGSGSPAGGGGAAAGDAGATGAKPASKAEIFSKFGVDALRLGYRWSFNPAAGSIDTTAMLHNGTTTAYDVKLRVWLTGPTGNALGEPVEQTVHMKARSVEDVSVNVGPVGQWGLVTSHLTATPPTKLDGVAMSPIDRSQWVIVPPFAILAGLVVSGGLGAVGYLLWRRMPRPLAGAGAIA